MPTHNASEEVPKRGWSCPGEEQLAAYVDGTVSGEAKTALERHISGCGYCLKLVAGAAAEPGRSSPMTPAYLRKRAEELTSSSSHNWRWVWALGPALACLIAVAIFVRQPQKHLPVIEPAPPAAPEVATPQSAPSSSSAAPSDSTRALGRQPQALRLLSPARGAVLGRSQLQFEWTAVPNTSYYQIRMTRTDGELVWEVRSQQPRVHAPDKMKFAAGQYFFWVTAYLNDGRTTRSDPLEFQLHADR